MIRVKRVYDPAATSDGARFLVERLWPRGVKKEALAARAWLRDIAPSTALRKWFAHETSKWPEFQRRYRRELATRQEICRPLVDVARAGDLTLLYSARDAEHNSAVVLKAYLEEIVARAKHPGARPQKSRRNLSAAKKR